MRKANRLPCNIPCQWISFSNDEAKAESRTQGDFNDVHHIRGTAHTYFMEYYQYPHRHSPQLAREARRKPSGQRRTFKHASCTIACLAILSVLFPLMEKVPKRSRAKHASPHMPSRLLAFGSGHRAYLLHVAAMAKRAGKFPAIERVSLGPPGTTITRTYREPKKLSVIHE